jgi:WD40 repeat protein
VETRTELSGLDGDLEKAHSIAFSRAGDLLAVGDSVGERQNAEVTIWDWEGRRRLVTLSGHVRAIHALAFSPGGSRLASGDSAGIVKLWDVVTGQERASLLACEPGAALTAIAISADGSLFVTANFLNRSVRFSDAADGETRGELPRTGFGVTDSGRLTRAGC